VIKHSFLDKAIINFDKLLKPELYLEGNSNLPGNEDSDDINFTPVQKKDAIGKMRINHCGEVCAQALYLGQSITARNPEIRDELKSAAQEEVDHLYWCAARIKQLGGKTSILNPIWFIGSFTLGTIAGLAGDKWSLGFLAETEKQVGEHLQNHINHWPEFDKRSLAILKQMHEDELKHADTANECGAAQLPYPIPDMMRFSAKFMTKTTYFI
jgi:ubiquinone biosynthesis monooxygenase Coq7